MTLAAKQPLPAAPLVYQAYLSFYVAPGDVPLLPNVVRVDCYCSTSSDGAGWSVPTLVDSGNSVVGFWVNHSELDTSTSYQYYYKYVYSDGSISGIGHTTTAGPAQLVNNPAVNMSNIPAASQSVALVTAGTFRGTVFQTAATPPLVQMDPSGVHAIGPAGPMFILNAAQGTAYFNGYVAAQSVALTTFDGIAATPSTADSYISWSDSLSTPAGLNTGYVLSSYNRPPNYGTNPPNVSQLEVIGVAETSSDTTNTYVGAEDDQNNNFTGIFSTQTARGTNAAVYVVAAGAPPQKLLDQNGSSAFLPDAPKAPYGFVGGTSPASNACANTTSNVYWYNNAVLGNGMACNGQLMTVPTSGTYMFQAMLTLAQFTANNNGYMQIFVVVNGTVVEVGANTNTYASGTVLNFPTMQMTQMLVGLTAGTTVGTQMYQSLYTGSVAINGGYQQLWKISN